MCVLAELIVVIIVVILAVVVTLLKNCVVESKIMVQHLLKAQFAVSIIISLDHSLNHTNQY